MNENKIDLSTISNIHMVGILGSGMFAISNILVDWGFKVTGSDASYSKTAEKIKNLDIKLTIGHKTENVFDSDLVVFSAAVTPDNPEIEEAKRRKIPCVERSEMLGIMAKKYRNSIAVAGTHGKTSTTSIITHILLECNMDPTALIGGTFPRINGNSCSGNSDIFVCEACEYLDNFLNLDPSISVVLNVDSDHLDYFKDIEHTKSSFGKFMAKTKDICIINGDDKNSVEASKSATCKKVFYGFNEKNDIFIKNLKFDEFSYKPNFDMFYKNEKIVNVHLNTYGKHNISNFLAAAAVCLELGISPEKIAESIKNFKNPDRRLQFIGSVNNITVFDDFAHHPSEIAATLSTMKDMNFNKILAVFQPHTFSRTAAFLSGFASSLSIADVVVVTDILPARETANFYKVHSKDIAEKIENCVYISSFEDITDFICENAKPNDLVITVGAGDIYKCTNMIMESLKRKQKI